MGVVMLRFLRSFAVASLLVVTSSLAWAMVPEGVWRGSLGPGVIDLAIVVTFALDDAGQPVGTIDIPAQGLIGYPLVAIRSEGGRTSFAMPGIPGDPTFDGVGSGDRLEGTFTQGGQVLAFVLERDFDEPTPLRPQEPRPPFGYAIHEVEVAAGEITLAGTLTLPEGEGMAPALLLLSGSGAQNRDQEILGHKPFWVIADHLTRAGFAVLRLDDRGVGGSGGSDSEASYDELVADALAGVAFLRAHPRIDAERVGLLGHSQGGYLAPVAAGVPESGVAFVILVAAPAVDGAAVLLAQNEAIITLGLRSADPDAADAVIAQVVAEQIAFLEALIPLVAAGDRAAVEALVAARLAAELAAVPASQRPDADAVAAIVAAQVEATVSPSFASFLAFDPRPHLEALTVPTLALFGGVDAQVLPEQNEAPMRAALAGHPDATVLLLAGLNHLMQPSVDGDPGAYGSIPVTFDPAALDAITRWLQGRFVVE
jgi:uncharacterized protein